MNTACSTETAHAYRLGHVLRAVEHRLRDAGTAGARAKTEFLVSGVLACGRGDLVVRREDRLTPGQVRRVEALAGRLVDGEPLQYVEGFTSFRGYRLACDRRALVPRPETEQLVEAALAFEPAWRTGRPRMADVGTGSGCIAVAMACSHPRVIVHASDVSGEALELARVNVQRHGLADRVRLVQSDLLDACEAGSLDLVISNPPYVASAALAALPAEVRLYEPVQALDGGSDGLHVLRRLVPRAREKLRPGGALFVEIGEQQGRAVRLLMETHGFGHVRVQQDLAGRDRIARGVIT